MTTSEYLLNAAFVLLVVRQARERELDRRSVIVPNRVATLRLGVLERRRYQTPWKQICLGMSQPSCGSCPSLPCSSPITSAGSRSAVKASS